MTPGKYRCKHAVEAMRWTDTDENREAFFQWFSSHDAEFATRGPVVCLPNGGEVSEGEWIVLFDSSGENHDDFVAFTDEQFRDEYAEVAS